MKKFNCMLAAVLVIVGAIAMVQDLRAGSIADPTIAVKEFTPSGGSVFKDQVKSSLDSLDVAISAVIDQIDASSVAAAAVTAGTNATQTVTFGTAFTAAPVVVCVYTEDPGDVRPIFVTSVTASNFVANITADKNFAYIAIGAR